MDNKAKVFRGRKEPEYRIYLAVDTEKTTKVVSAGTSDLKYISLQYLSDKPVKVEKVIKYTLAEEQKYIDTLKRKEDKMDAFVLHHLKMILQKRHPKSDKICKMANDIKEKFEEAQVIVSLGLPQTDEGINRKISKVNVLLKEKLEEEDSVSLCDSGNLFLEAVYREVCYMRMENSCHDEEPEHSRLISNKRSTRRFG